MAAISVDLYLLRHAHAGDPARWDGDDARRPLSAKGRLQADAMARQLAALGVDIEAVISSPKIRARQTADPIAKALGLEVRVDDRVVGLGDRSLEAILADAGDPRSALLVGHDPEFSDLVAELAGAASIPMRKGALARFDAPRPLRSGGAILRWLIPPDALAGDPGR
jgi:phosphohistidine phosphatase SixA